MLHTVNSLSRFRSRRLRPLVAAAALLTAPAVLLATPGTADAAQTRNRADAAAGWLGRQLDGDSHLMTATFDGQTFPDYGLTADVVLALDAAKVGRRSARQATGALRRHVLDYTGGGVATERYAGAYAKLLLVASAQQADPRAFGSGPRKDLVSGLRALECGTPARRDCAAEDKGRFSDDSAVRRLQQHDRPVAGPDRPGASHPTRGLSRCAVLPARAAVPQRRASRETFGVVALQALGRRDRLRRAGADDGRQPGCQHGRRATAGRWLKRQQHANGSFTGNGVRNANSTALAAQALTAVGRHKAAAKAAVTCAACRSRCGGKAADRGWSATTEGPQPATRSGRPARRCPRWPGPPWPTSAGTARVAACPRLAC